MDLTRGYTANNNIAKTTIPHTEFVKLRVQLKNAEAEAKSIKEIAAVREQQIQKLQKDALKGKIKKITRNRATEGHVNADNIAEELQKLRNKCESQKIELDRLEGSSKNKIEELKIKYEQTHMEHEELKKSTEELQQNPAAVDHIDKYQALQMRKQLIAQEKYIRENKNQVEQMKIDCKALDNRFNRLQKRLNGMVESKKGDADMKDTIIETLRDKHAAETAKEARMK